MSTELNKAEVTKIGEVEIDGIALKNEFTSADMFVCGLCHLAFHYLEVFQEHKLFGDCTKISVFQDQTTMDNKPDFLGFLLWKNSQTTHLETWQVYKMWSSLPKNSKNYWIQAGLTISGFGELAKLIPDKMITIEPQNGNVEDYLPPAVMKTNEEFPSDQHFGVERIIARRFNQKIRQFEYLLKCEGYQTEQNIWESTYKMGAYSHLIKQFEDSLVKNGSASTPGKMAGLGQPPNTEQIKNMEVVESEVVSPQAKVEHVGIKMRPFRSSKQKAIKQVKYWCGKMKATEEVIEKPSQPNVLKRNSIMSEEEDENKDTPVLKKKYFHQDFKDEDRDNPSIVSFSENEEPNDGRVISISQLTMEELINNNVPRSVTKPSPLPVLNREDLVQRLKTYINTIYKNPDPRILQISPHLTNVLLTSTKVAVKLETNTVPTSGIYIFSHSEGFTKLTSDKTQHMMMRMDDPKKSHLVYANETQAPEPPKKILDTMKARESVNQSSPLLKPYFKKTLFAPTKNIQTTVNIRKMEAEGEKMPEPIPPSSLKTIDETSLFGRHQENSTLPTMIKLEPGTGNIGNQIPMTSIGELENKHINCTPHMQNNEPRQNCSNHKEIPDALTSHLCTKKTISRPNNNSNESLHVSSGISKIHSSLNIPAHKIPLHQPQIIQPFQGQTITTDESGQLILSVDSADSNMTTITDHNMLYEVSTAQLAAYDGNGMMQNNQNSEGIIDFGSSDGQIILDPFDLVSDEVGNLYMKDNENGLYVPILVTEQGGQFAIQINETLAKLVEVE